MGYKTLIKMIVKNGGFEVVSTVEM